MIDEVWNWVAANSNPIQATSILAGTAVAFYAIFHNGLISRREATIEMVNAQFGEEGAKYADFKNLMQTIEADDQEIGDYAAPAFDNSEAQDIILRQLNRYELISLGIKQRVFNEKFYRMWFFSQVVRDFDKLKPFIDRTRELYNNDAYFCEFESLACRWKKKKHPVKHPPVWKLIAWLLKGDLARVKRALNAE